MTAAFSKLAAIAVAVAGVAWIVLQAAEQFVAAASALAV